MQAFAKLATLPHFLRRACVSMRPALRLIMPPRVHAGPADEACLTECEPGIATFRVTDRRRAWTRARYFADSRTAAIYASAKGGVVWERYVGPTGACNWWSLAEDEWRRHLGPAGADDRPPGPLS